MSKDIEGLNISLKSLLSVGAIIFLLIGEYILLHKEIEEAKRLPTSEVSKLEVDYIRKDISIIQDEIKLIKEDIK
jgi:hypothetical protein|tara:strand:+ start:254 stop:478 length:225 start_codon:yes stop_codon:yes gene_type:complete